MPAPDPTLPPALPPGTTPAPTSAPLWEQYRAQLESYRDAKVNFDLDRAHEYTAASGWRLDDYATDLPSEAPGPPVPGGVWERACQVLRDYKFPPPDLITGIFAPDQPLAERLMLLRAQFLGFTFWFGVRIGAVLDEQRSAPDDGQPEQVWGYSYRTLAGHFEKGEIVFTVHKHLTTGRITFQIHAYSRADHIRNPFYRIGFKLFGRRLQLKFAHESLRRMRELVGSTA